MAAVSANRSFGKKRSKSAARAQQTLTGFCSKSATRPEPSFYFN